MDKPEFDQYAGDYRQHHAASIRSSGEEPEFFHRYKVEDVAAELARRNLIPTRILDFGGGVGNSIPFLREAFPASEIVLLDTSPESLRLAGDVHAESARLLHFDGKTIPFPDGHFDLVFAACVFHHIPEEDQIPALIEIERVLAPGGSFFVFEHNPFNPLTVQAVRNCPFDENAVLIRAGKMRRRLEAARLHRNTLAYRIFFPNALRKLRVIEPHLRWLPLGAQYYVHAVKA
jgi:ubiquinone/menaquinone biosynthesis C-methylase UbiE